MPRPQHSEILDDPASADAGPTEFVSVAPPLDRSKQPSVSTRPDWLDGLAFMAIDIFSWIVLYGFISFLRRDIFFADAF